MVTGEEAPGPRDPLSKKRFSPSFSAPPSLPPPSPPSCSCSILQRKHLQKVRGKCLARLFEQSSIFATVSQLRKTAEFKKKITAVELLDPVTLISFTTKMMPSKYFIIDTESCSIYRNAVVILPNSEINSNN